MSLIDLLNKKSILPLESEALSGRDEEVEVPEEHFVKGTPLKGPFPEKLKQAVFGMGCFWGVERRFWELEGVYSTSAGYAGGFTKNPSYKEVCTGFTGHNEVVLVVYDPDTISYESLLKTFWEDHDPTQGMRQGNDIGTQYRSAIFCLNDIDINICNEYINSLTKKMKFNSNIVTTVDKLNKFYLAEIEHKDYYNLNKNQPYCSAIIGPKVRKFMENKPNLIK